MMTETTFFEDELDRDFNIPADLTQVTDEEICNYFFLVWGELP